MDGIEKLAHLGWQFPNTNWNDSGFQWDKAYVCAIFCSLAYAAVPEANDIETPRYQIIPSHLYQDMFIRGAVPTEEEIKRLLGAYEPIIISTEHIVSLILRLNGMLFVAVRGTEMSSFYDWQANISAKKIELPDHEEVKLHSGFYGETLVHAEKVAQKLIQISNENIPIYITGHSLGGAVAAIMNILFDEWIAKYPLHRPSPPYTFGMPRYGDTGAVQNLSSPYAVFHPKDVIPKVPPEFLGYADCDTKFSVVSSMHTARKTSKIKAVVDKIISSVTVKPVREHFIESYRKNIASILAFDESKFLS